MAADGIKVKIVAGSMTVPGFACSPRL